MILKSSSFIACADVHLTDSCPENRKDKDFLNTILEKVEEIFEITSSESSLKLLVIAGDLFNSPKIPYRVLNKMEQLKIKFPEITVLVVPGQHDFRYHVNNLENTPLGNLKIMGLMEVLSPNTPIYKGPFRFIGAGWQETISDDTFSSEERKKFKTVVLTHQTVVEKDPLWPGQKDYVTAEELLNLYPKADCIISGDNHAPHLLKKENRIQLNCGTIVRNKKTLMHYEPRVWKVSHDTLNWKITPLKLKIKPFKEVFDLNKIQKEEEIDKSKELAEERISQFIESLPNNDSEQPNFTEVLNSILKELKPSKEIKTIISNVMEKILK